MKYEITGSYTEKGGVVDVHGSVHVRSVGEGRFLIKFGVVTGDFVCSNTGLTSLKGAPRVVGGNFCCNENELTSLEGAPEAVGGDFLCRLGRSR